MIRILVVEDDIVQLSLYRLWFSEIINPSSGVLIQFATTGLEAESLLKSNDYQLSFMDLALPYISGAELITRYRTKMGKLIVASAYSNCYNIEGVDLFLQKPILESEMAEQLKDFLGDKIYVGQKPDNNSAEYSII